MNKTQLLLRSCALLCTVLLGMIACPRLCAQSSVNYNNRSTGSNKAISALSWVYSGADGNRANTIGSAANHDPLPFTTYYLGNHGYSPAQISIAYGLGQLPPGDNGTNQVIVIIDAYGSQTIQSDLDNFDNQFGLPACTVNVTNINGTPDFTSTNAPGWVAETSLDVEWAHAIAPGATIDLVVVPDATQTQIFAAFDYIYNNLSPNAVSMSFGWPESWTEVYQDWYFTNTNTAFVAATGDHRDTNWPATSPWVLAVGGTTMKINTNTGQIASEIGWSGSLDGIAGQGSGGGVSAYEPEPQYQTGYSSRAVPDVSYDADPYTGYQVYLTLPDTNGVQNTNSTNSGWAVYGGTSAGAPQWAALATLCNWNAAATNTTGSTNFINNIYAYNLIPIRDIISGSNGVYSATVGYDLATGLGSPQFSIPSITSFTPTNAAEGASIVIKGTNFDIGTTVSFADGPFSTNVTISSSTNMTAVIPGGTFEGNPTFGPLYLSGPNGIAVSDKSINITESIPTISSFTPTSGIPGTTVTINGTKFYDVSQVEFNSNSSPSMTVVSPTLITATVPTSATTGKIQLITMGFHTYNSATSFTVTKPTISSFSPTSGSVGSTLTINGTNLSNVQQVQFASSGFGGTVYTSAVTVVSSTQITTVVPATAITGHVTVWSYLNGSVSSGTSTVNFTVTP